MFLTDVSPGLQGYDNRAPFRVAAASSPAMAAPAVKSEPQRGRLRSRLRASRECRLVGRTSAVLSLALAQMAVGQATDMSGVSMQDDGEAELGSRRAVKEPAQPTSGYAMRAKARRPGIN